MEEIIVDIELANNSIPFSHKALNAEVGSRAIALSIAKSGLEDLSNVAKSRSLKVHKFGIANASKDMNDIVTHQVSFFPPIDRLQPSTNADAWSSVIYVSRGKNSSFASLRLLGEEIVFVPIDQQGIYKIKIFFRVSSTDSKAIEATAYSQDIYIKVDPVRLTLELSGD